MYGNNNGALRQLRAYVGGRLRVGQNNTMPTRPAGGKCMIPKEDTDKACFLAGMYTSYISENNIQSVV